MNINLDKYKCIIWDWNGTLLNDSWLCVEILGNILRRRDRPEISSEEYQAVFGFPVRNYYDTLGLCSTDDSFEKITNEFMDEYNRRKIECSLQDGAVNLLEHFSKTGRKQFILSASNHVTLNECVSHCNVSHYFEKVTGISDHFARSKVDVGLSMMRELPFSPDEILFVGDTLHDHEVATAMGVDCVLVPSGHQSPDRISSSGAKIIESLVSFL